MNQEVEIALIGGGAAILGGVLSGAYQHLRDYISRPKLCIDYMGTSANQVTAEYQQGRAEIYIRARVRNTGREVARSCRVYLAELTEIRTSGQISTSLYDAKQLQWAGLDFIPLDIPRGVNLYVDLAWVSKDQPGWRFSVQRLFASQSGLKTYRGTYRFHLLATAHNADPAVCSVDVSYDGDWHSLRAWEVKSAPNDS